MFVDLIYVGVVVILVKTIEICQRVGWSIISVRTELESTFAWKSWLEQ